MKPDPNDLFQSYAFADWNEDIRDVLWWKLPISEPPYCGTPLDLGRGVMATMQIGTETLGPVYVGDTGGWPFSESDEPNLVFTLLPGAIRMPRDV